MNSNPIVSICIPTFNAAEFFEPCLQSALAQTYPNLEILISDDGSTDATLDIVKRYQQQNPQIRLVQNPSKGMVDNWNNCIVQSKGDWVKFLFQDDLLKPHCVETMLQNCLANNVDVGLCSRDFIIHDDVPKNIRNDFKYRMVLPARVFGEVDYISPQTLACAVAELLPDNILGEPTSYLFHKKIFEKTGMFHSDYKQAIDMEFILRLGLISGLAFNSTALATFRVHGKSESSANLKPGEAETRYIASITGDTILLYYHFLNDPAFALLKETIGEDVLRLHINHIYYSGCKHKGRKLFNKALEPIRKKYKELGEMKYSIFKYAHYRKLYREWERKNRW